MVSFHSLPLLAPLLGILSLSLAASSSAQESSSAEIKASATAMPWVPLFDGQTLQGWVNYDGSEPTGWVVEDGVLTRADGGSDLRTAKEYDNFELALEWRISPKGNSGIMYRVKAGDGQPYFSGPEYQILDDEGHGLEPNAVTAAASLYGLVPAENKSMNAVGEFNHARILVRGNHVEHWLNEVKVLEIEMHSKRWNELVAASKFKEWPQFGESPTGYIDLQDHGNPVWFRNISIRPLAPRPNSAGPTLQNITLGSAKALLEQYREQEGLVVIDVRTAEEFAAGHLNGVLHLDFFADDFQQQLAALNRDQAYLLYCRSGRRSGKALGMMQELGFHEAYNLLGGYQAWSAAATPAAE